MALFSGDLYGDEPLCSTGQHLWDNSYSEYTEEKYKKYMCHILDCKECQDALEIEAKDMNIIRIYNDEVE